MKLAFNESVLPNGIRIVSSHMPHVASAAVGIWAGVGGRYESARSSGLSHFIEHLLFKGSFKRDARALSESIEGRGGYFNAFTQEESTCYYARVPAEHLSDSMEVLSDMYLRPRFDREEIDRERSVILEEIMMYRDQPSQHVQDMLSELLWDRHALGRPLIGTPRNILRVSRPEIREFKSKKYVPGNTVVSLAGNVDHDACVRALTRWFGRFQKRTCPRYTAVTRKTPQQASALLSKSVEQAHLAMGLRLFGRHDPRRFALKILSVVLGENMSSRLFQTVRERHALAYSIQSGVHLFEDTGALVIEAGLDRSKVDKALGLIVKEMTRLKRRKVSAADLTRAKDYAIGQLRIGLESSVNQMIWLGENLLGYGGFTQPEDVVRKLERVRAEEVQRLAETMFHPKRVSLALIAPDKGPSLDGATARRIAGLRSP